MLKNKEIAVTPNNGSHFVTLKMIEGFLAPEYVKTTNAGSMQKRIEALNAGKVAAVSLMEPWISVAQKMGLRILIESHSTRSEAAGDDLDGNDAGQRCSGRRRGRSRRSRGTPRPTSTTSSARPAACWSRTSSRPGACCTPRRSPTRASASTTPTTGPSSGT